MKKFILAYLFLITTAFPSWAKEPPHDSLFFTPEEASSAEALAEKSTPAGQAAIHLGAVMYYGPQDWTLWLQGEKWTPETTHEDLHVLDVTPNAVLLSWKRDTDSPAKEITLMPNETYQIATGKIIAGP